MFLLMISILVAAICSSYFYYLYSIKALSILQLNGYSINKFVWSEFNLYHITENRHSIIAIFTFILAIELLIAMKLISVYFVIVQIALINLFMLFVWFKQRKRQSKTPLVITARVKRQIMIQTITTVFLFFMVIFLSARANLLGFVLLLFLMVCFNIVMILPACMAKLPEKLIYLHYVRKAKNKLLKHENLKIIGITGSYGKTSVKFFLTQILKEEFFTVCTPKSFNTEMGITKTILQYLKPHHEFFVVEMGADKLNDIKKICKFVKPNISLLTNIGVQHLKTFKTKANLVKTKLQIMSVKGVEELVGYFGVDSEPVYDAFLKHGGKNYSISLQNKNSYCYANTISTSESGMSFFVNINKKRFKLSTVLLGDHNALNILMAVCVAYNLGVEIGKIKKAVANLKHIKHRLEPVKLSSGALLLDNSFNSNPVGAKHSIKVLSNLNFSKKIIITPGLVELGNLQYEKNYAFAKQMVGVANFVCIVNYINKNALYMGLIENGFNKENIMFFENFKAAFNFIKPQLNSDSVLLIENDLPDNYI